MIEGFGGPFCDSIRNTHDENIGKYFIYRNKVDMKWILYFVENLF